MIENKLYDWYVSYVALLCHFWPDTISFILKSSYVVVFFCFFPEVKRKKIPIVFQEDLILFENNNIFDMYDMWYHFDTLDLTPNRSS